jgi:hypothetical protein
VNSPRDPSPASFQNQLRRFLRADKPSTPAMRIAVVLTLLFFLATAFRIGWTTPETDFPNYYTAARALRQGQPLRSYYDWTWFARQMDYAGNGTQLGAYTPQTPLTMLPFVPLTGLPPQRAKQIWLLLNLGFLIATVWLLSKVTKFSFAAIWLLAFCGYFSLRTNFVYGQYYVFLLFLLTLVFYFLQRKNERLSGVVTGIAFALKLYGGPFFLYFAARRQWKALAGMIVAVLALLAVAILLFGAADIHYYATRILPRTLEGGSIDPYNPGVSTVSTFLCRTFMAERELNPNPLWRAPQLFFFLRTFISLSIVAFLFLGTNTRRSSAGHDFAWFVIAAVLLSTSTASYTFIVLLLPAVLLLEEFAPWQSALLVCSFVLLTLPLRPAWLFPKVWLLFGLFILAGYQNWRQMPRWLALTTVAPIALFSFFDARHRMLNYAHEPAQRFERVFVQPGAAFSSFPVVTLAGVFYQSMGKDRYVLRWSQGDRNQELSFPGHALRPRRAPDGTSIYFELVANQKSTMMQFDPSTGRASPLTIPVPADPPISVVSPEGKWVAFESTENGPTQIGLQDLASGAKIILTGGNCNNSAPAWALDSAAILFASDCGRAFGLPTLYRAPLPGKKN